MISLIFHRYHKMLPLFFKIKASFYRKVQKVFRLLMPIHFLRPISPSSFIKCLLFSNILQESGQCLSFKNMLCPSLPQFSLSALLVHGHSTYCIKLQTFVYFCLLQWTEFLEDRRLNIHLHSKFQSTAHDNH